MHRRKPDESGGPQICWFRNSEKSSSAGSIDQESSDRGALIGDIAISTSDAHHSVTGALVPLSRRGLISVSVRVCYSVSVKTTDILAALDAEIARLQQARNALAGVSGTKRRGRPPASVPPRKTAKKKRVLSAAAREKIAAAQRRRWAKQKKSA